MAMLQVEQAREQILAAATALSTARDSEHVHIYKAQTRVLAEDIIADINVPPADNSAMDGYAVATADLEAFASGKDILLPVSQRITAGAETQALQPGTAARIFTGSEIPPGADAVVMQENCQQEDGNRVRIIKAPQPRENIRPCGQDIRQGSRIAEQGQALSPQLVGLLASEGKAKVRVYRRLKVALLSTGNELVEPGQPLKRGQIYNSNQVMLSHWLNKLGCTLTHTQIVEDNIDSTIAALKDSSLKADLVISSGGVSVGEEDHVKAAMEKLGQLQLWKVAMKPGKPLAFGRFGSSDKAGISSAHEGALFLGLPGNPVSSFVTFFLFGLPLIKKMRGEEQQLPLSFFLPANFASKAQSRREYCRVQIRKGQLEKFPNQSSGVLTSVCWADGLACIPQDTAVNKGDLLEVFPFVDL